MLKGKRLRPDNCIEQCSKVLSAPRRLFHRIHQQVGSRASLRRSLRPSSLPRARSTTVSVIISILAKSLREPYLDTDGTLKARACYLPSDVEFLDYLPR